MANSTILYACTDDGLAIFNKPGTLPEWLPPRHVLPGKHVTSAWGEPGPPIRVLAVADGTLLLSENGGRTWDAVGPEAGASGSVVSLSYEEAGHVLFAHLDGGVWQSTDGGATWQVQPAGTLPTAPDDQNAGYIASLPADMLAYVLVPGAAGMPPALVVGTSAGLEVSQDGGTTWTQPTLPQEGAVTALARDPERRDRLYAATDGGYLAESGNRGQTWQAINTEPLARVASIYVVRI
ncbi:MAG: hypothetical protein ABI670_09565 [Chloroflexota bacterium]